MRIRLLVLATVIFMQGCNQVKTAPPEVSIEPAAPVQKFSRYAGALERLGEMIEGFNDPAIAMMVEPVPDSTASGGKLPADVTLLTESALQNIGEKVVLLPYADRSFAVAQQDLGLNLYTVKGAITEFDADTDVQSSGVEGGLFVKGLDIDASAEDSSDFSKGTIAMDFMVLDAFKGYYVPGVKATAKATLQKKTRTKGYSFSIVGNGFGINGNTTSKTPVHHVINIMLEYSMVQLVGRLRNYPYWMAIQGADPDYRDIKKTEKRFSRMSIESQIMNTTYIMSILDPEVRPLQSEMDSYTEQKVIELKRRMGLFPDNSKLTREFYARLLTESPGMLSENKLLQQADAVLDEAFQ